MFTLSTILLAVLAGLAVPADQAWAHEESHQLGGLKLVMTDPAGRPEKRKFLFKTKNQLGINDVSVDPSQTSSSLIVRGAAAGDGSSGVVYLEAAGWKRIGKAADPKGWKYKKDWRYSNSLGVNKVLIKKGSNGGKLLVKAKGQFWPYWIADAQGTVELSLLLGGEQYCAEFAGDRAQVKKNESGKVIAKSLLAPASCGSVCGNGKLELGETCDDGNTDDADTCTAGCETACTANNTDYAGTFEAIQALIFDSPVYQCSNDICHGATVASGGLDLRAGASHAALINVPAQINPNQMRITPGDQDLSLLYNKIAEKTVGDVDAPGTPMPANAETVSSDYLELLRIWIRGGAQATGVAEGTAELLDACLPEPTPNEIPPLDPPDPAKGFQVRMPSYRLGPQSETENCRMSYYDISAPGLVPSEYLIDCPGTFPGTNDHGSNAGKCVAYSYRYFTQDPQSHHAIVGVYTGASNYDDPAWGQWKCRGNGATETPCDPANASDCSGDSLCAPALAEGNGCNTANGPDDFSSITRRGWTGAQESVSIADYPDGVYSMVPLKGLVSWNSHAFNLTNQEVWLDAYNNTYYTNNLTFQVRGGLDISRIFVQHVAPFEEEEYCMTHTFAQGSRVFMITSHTHRHGKRFRYYWGPQTECTGGNIVNADPGCLPGAPADIFYESYNYQDPVYMRFDPPLLFQGTKAERTIKACSLFDNGKANPSEVKRQSTSPAHSTSNLGGPCPNTTVACLGGANQGALCYGNDDNCPDSICDACPATGGLTTEDEMFAPSFRYYIDPE